MTKNNDLFDTLVVVKRSGQRTTFQGDKIALAIQKGFSSTDIPYRDEDVNKVYEKVLKKIDKNYKDRKTINIENIQDIIEETLKEEKFMDIYEAFKNYRMKRMQSRKTFVIKQQHKFLKAIEFLGLDNINNTKSEQPYVTLQRFGKTISIEFAKAYLLDNKNSRAHDNGLIYIDSLEAMPMGSIDSLEISFKDYLNTNQEIKKEFTKDKKISVFLSKMTELLFKLKKEIYGGCALVSFDKDLEEVVLANYKEIVREYFNIYLKTSKMNVFVKDEELDFFLDNIKDIDDTEVFDNYLELKNNFMLILEMAKEKIKEELRVNLKCFFREIGFLPISINFGSSDNNVGKLIINEIIEASVDRDNLAYFFKVKNKGSLNEELLEKYKEKNLMMHNFNYSFLDNSLNNIDEEVGYFKNGERVIEDNTTPLKKPTTGKGNIASCSINITRIALKNRNNLRGFYQDLDKLITSAKEALLERFEIDCTRSLDCFPYLLSHNLWTDGDKIKVNDRFRKLYKHGTLTIKFCGLKEALYAIDDNTSKHNDIARDILKYMAKKIETISEENNLNFVLSSIVSEKIRTEFKRQDTAIYGKIKNITDKESYGDSSLFSDSLKDISYLQKKCLGGALYTYQVKNKKELDDLVNKAISKNIMCLKIIP